MSRNQSYTITHPANQSIYSGLVVPKESLLTINFESFCNTRWNYDQPSNSDSLGHQGIADAVSSWVRLGFSRLGPLVQKLYGNITATEYSLRTLWTQLLAMDVLVVKQPANSISVTVAATYLLITSYNINNINNYKKHFSLPTLPLVRVLPSPLCKSLWSATSP